MAAEAGFRYHHADEDYVMMTLQIEEGAYIPPHATHYIGGGGGWRGDQRGPAAAGGVGAASDSAS